jgi:galactokinase
MHRDSALSRAAGGFRRVYRGEPRWAAAAPGRVNLMGEHTDYNDGFVMPMAIDRRTVVVAGPSAAGRMRWVSDEVPGALEFAAAGPFEPGVPKWGDYIRGVAAEFASAGVALPGLDAFVASDVPTGGGLSSSAALEVAAATLFEAATGRISSPVEKALLCWRAETTFAGLPCGIMDPFAVTLARAGHCLLIDCRSRETRQVPLLHPGLAVLIINSNVRHELTTGEYAVRRRQCEQASQTLGVAALRDATPADVDAASGRLGELIHRRARHVVTENERTLRAAKALEALDWDELGALMYASHASLRDDYEVSCPELDVIVDAALAIGRTGGVIGCRMTGGGFGGSAVALAWSDAVPDITARIARDYRDETGRESTIFTTRPSAGATVVQLGGA